MRAHPIDQRGKHQLIESLAASHTSQLVRFFTSRLRDRTEAHDLVQEVFVRLLKLQRLDLVREPQAYLYTVAANIARETAIKRTASPSQITLEDTDSDELNNTAFLDPNSPEETAQLENRMLELQRAIASLAPRVRAALVWSCCDSIAQETIAARLGSTRTKVRRYIARGMAECRKIMSSEA